MKKLLIILVLILTVNFSYSQNQVKLSNNKSQSSIKYSAIHPLHDWEGESKKVKSILVTDATKTNIVATAISIPVSSFNSGNSNRDSHMIEVTEAIKFPSITFQSTKIEQSGEKLNVTGKMTFHGVTKIVTTTAEMKKIKGHIIISGNFVILMTDYKIERPSFMGMKTDDELKINFTIAY